MYVLEVKFRAELKPFEGENDNIDINLYLIFQRPKTFFFLIII